jgi:hypothetical protein
MSQFDFVRQHKTLRISPAMAAGIADTLWSMEDIAALCEANSGQEGAVQKDSVMAGILFAIAAVCFSAYLIRDIARGRTYPRERLVSRSNDPIEFWFVIGFQVAAVLVIVFSSWAKFHEEYPSYIGPIPRFLSPTPHHG